MRKQKFTRDETTTILIACLFNLANAMSAVFMNVYLYAYTGSLVVMSIYTIVRIGLFPFFFTLGGKWAQKHSFAGPLTTGLVFIMLSLLFVLGAQDQFAVHPELVYGVAALTGIGEGLFWLSLNSLNQIVSSPQSRSRFGYRRLCGNLQDRLSDIRRDRVDLAARQGPQRAAAVLRAETDEAGRSAMALLHDHDVLLRHAQLAVADIGRAVGV